MTSTRATSAADVRSPLTKAEAPLNGSIAYQKFWQPISHAYWGRRLAPYTDDWDCDEETPRLGFLPTLA